MSDKERGTGREGFTLIEVLVAMVILAVGLLALESMAIGAARMVVRADRQSQYTALATEHLERTMTNVRLAPANAVSGVTTVDGAQVATVVVPQAVAGRQMYTVTVTVTPPTGAVPVPPITVVGRELR